MNNRASLQLGGDNWAAKDGNLLAYKSSFSEKNFLPIEFTFERGADIAATRVNSSGLIEKYRENLLFQSNQFDTTWIESNASATNGQSGYDGSTDAWLLSKSAASGRIYQNVSVSGVATYSVYAKAGSTDWLFIIGSEGIYPEAYFDLSNGVVGNSSSNPNFISANIQDVGNGWYRCSITFNTSISRVWIYPADGDGDTSGTSGNLYIQDAQLEQGLVATDYIETGASTAQAGVLEDLPRINYSGSTPSLLLEPSRTNQIRLSEYFEDTTNYDLRSADVNTNYATSPEGVQNATKVIPKNGTTDFRIQTQHTFGVSGDNVLSVFAKYESGGFQYLILATNSVFQTYAFDIQNGTKVGNAGGGTIADADATIEDYGNGWYRCSIKSNNTANADGVIYLSDDGTNTTATGDGSKGMLIYGFQGEQSATYPTSYIPTYGTADERTEDSCLINPMSTEYSTNYTFFGEFERIVSEDEESILMQLYDNSNSGNSQYRILNRSNAQLRTRIYFSGNNTSIISATDSFQLGQTIKWALRYDNGSIKVFIDGEEIGDTTQTVGGIDVISLERMKVKQILLFDSTLSDADCRTLTT